MLAYQAEPKIQEAAQGKAKQRTALDKQVILKVDNKASLVNVPDKVLGECKKQLTLSNPKYQDAVKYGRWITNLDPEVRLWSKIPGGICFSRGFTRQCLEILKKQRVNVELQDCRKTLSAVNFQFQGQLRDYQKQAVNDALKRDFGVISASTGSGKTIMALKIIAERKQPALILVHTKELLCQWMDRIESFLGAKVGQVGNGEYDIQPVTVAIVNTAKKHLDELPEYFGQLIVDECHRVPSNMFIEVVQAFDCRYMLGLSATAYRRDGLTKLIYLTLGDQVHEVDSKELKANGAVLAPKVIIRKTDFRYFYRDDYPKLLSTLTEDLARNKLIAGDVINQFRQENEICLLISDRVGHCQSLAKMLDDAGLWVEVLTGQTSKAERERIVSDVQAGKIDVLVSTIQLIGEGFDCKGLSSLFLATPIKFKGRLLQVIGRILRPASGKRPVVYDYQDPKVGVLKAQAWSRTKALQEVSTC